MLIVQPLITYAAPAFQSPPLLSFGVKEENEEDH